MKDELLDNRNYQELNKAFILSQHTISKQYLSEIGKYPLVKPSEELLSEKSEKYLRFFNLKELSCKKDEDMFQKLSTIYYASMSLGCSLIVMLDVEKCNAPVKIYIGIKGRTSLQPISKEEQNQIFSDVNTSFDTLKSGFNGNFPGTKFTEIYSDELPSILDDIFNNSNCVSSVSCVASTRDKSNTQKKDFIQGLEKFIDAMSGNSYTALFIAEPVSDNELLTIKDGYESMYSTLSSFSKTIWTYNETESISVMDSLSTGISKSITESTSKTQSNTFNVNVTLGMGSNTSKSHTDAQSSTKSHSSSINQPSTKNKFFSKVGTVGNLVGEVAYFFNPAVGTVIKGASNVIKQIGDGENVADCITNTISSSISDTLSKSFGLNGAITGGYSKGTAETHGTATTDTTNKQKTHSDTNTTGHGRSLQIENVNKSVEELLKNIDEQLVRLKKCADYGAYNFGAYFLSGSQETCILSANTYKSLMIGDGTSIENGAINHWNSNTDKNKVEFIKSYLRKFKHPVFALSVEENPTKSTDFITYTPSTMVSGLELPLHMGLPTKSVYGLPILEYAEFSRNVSYRNNDIKNNQTIKIGNIYHMGSVQNDSPVNLELQTLASHTFIAGSTGSGKSNTIYTLLNRLEDKNINFLVIEPTKGEYKSIFGGKSNIRIYGTNPKLTDTKMLHINPFAFPKDIHILEHLDRLTEIFNVCWPMYAAMPVILKEAIEKAYISSGWDIINSENKYSNDIFPTFTDILEQIKLVIASSDYSNDNKSDYTGSLVTRVKSLTNGLNRLIFNSNGIEDTNLFDENVIIDLSRVGSNETKSLIMGLLVLKLQEYRMVSHTPNEKLHHVTVLEEAHNLLKKTSVEQSLESANLIGKSVEMLSNSIAEMRTYGEGFIIADQSPNLLDISVIKNTNTKIILKLPDFSDRELVGKSIGLNDNQITELGKLENGVASVVQANWLEPVLCKIDKYQSHGSYCVNRIESKSFKINSPSEELNDINKMVVSYIINREFNCIYDKKESLKLKNIVLESNLSAKIKSLMLEYLNISRSSSIDIASKLLYCCLDAKDSIKSADYCTNIYAWTDTVVEALNPIIKLYSKYIDLILYLILSEHINIDSSYINVLCAFTEVFKSKGGVYNV